MFGKLLSEMVSRVPGAVGAVFLDREGETIDQAAPGVSRHDALIIGAYAGIFLSRIPSAAGERPARLVIEFAALTLIVMPLGKDYYVSLLLRKPYLEAVALRELETARILLEKEV